MTGAVPLLCSQASTLYENVWTRHCKLRVIFVGLNQGCVLSPALLPALMNDLVSMLKATNFGAELSSLVNYLLFADDVVLISVSPRQNFIVCLISQLLLHQKGIYTTSKTNSRL